MLGIKSRPHEGGINIKLGRARVGGTIQGKGTILTGELSASKLEFPRGNMINLD